jgi:hypothetical protein
MCERVREKERVDIILTGKKDSEKLSKSTLYANPNLP